LSNKTHSRGFLYCPKTQQILLQQDFSNPASQWALLDIKDLPKKTIPIYDYVLKGEKYIVSFAEVKTPKVIANTKWFTYKEISKLPLSTQTKQDIIVGHRVIDSQIRRDAGEQTIG
jgi:hypothetical protein